MCNVWRNIERTESHSQTSILFFSNSEKERQINNGEEEEMGGLEELERLQLQILHRIKELEKQLSLHHISTTTHNNKEHNETNNNGTVQVCSTTESRLSSILKNNGVSDFLFKRVPSDYYDRPLESRRAILDAPSIHHLCKSIVLVNTQAHASVTDCSDRNNSKYYVVVVQYSARLNAETVRNFLYSLNSGKIAKKKFNLRLAPEEESRKLTGYEHNGVTCIGMKTDIPADVPDNKGSSFRKPHHVHPMIFIVELELCKLHLRSDHRKQLKKKLHVILDEAISKLDPDFFWLGGGEIDLKLGIRTSQFIKFVNPFIVSCSSSI